MLTFIVMIIVSAGMLWLGIRTLRTGRDRSGISAIEWAILKVSKAEPLPVTESDQRWNRFVTWMLIVFSTIFLAMGLLIVGGTLLERSN